MSAHDTPSAPRKITLRWILSWVLGVIFFVPAIGLLFQQPISGLAMLAAAIILLPPTINYIQKKGNFHLSGGVKLVLVLILLGISGGTLNHSANKANSDTAQQPTNAKEAVAKEKSYVQVFTFKGNGIKKSEPFTITGSKFRIKYDCKGQLCQAWLKSPDNAFKLDMLMNTTGSTQDESIFYGAGTYYIEANTLGTYSMVVEDYR